jgi:hypothetical protein
LSNNQSKSVFPPLEKYFPNHSEASIEIDESYSPKIFKCNQFELITTEIVETSKPNLSEENEANSLKSNGESFLEQNEMIIFEASQNNSFQGDQTTSSDTQSYMKSWLNEGMNKIPVPSRFSRQFPKLYQRNNTNQNLCFVSNLSFMPEYVEDLQNHINDFQRKISSSFRKRSTS